MEIIFKDASCKLLKNTEIDFNKDSYVVSTNDNIIGHFNLKRKLFDVKNVTFLEYELLKKYRGKGLGKLFLRIIEIHLQEDYGLEEVYLLVKNDNELAKIVASNFGYSIDFNYTSDENYTLFYKKLSKVKKKILY